ncbi:MAG: hypothetical protein NVS9B6_15260 [Candidatus Limnocylindrales bacterium]
MSDAAALWGEQVRARLGQTAELRRAAGLDRDLWAPRRAKRYGETVGRATRADPFLARLLGAPARRHLDIGAGTGRYAVPLARAGRDVIAMEPSAGMRAVLEDGHRRITVLPAVWPTPVARVEVAFAAHVLYLVADAVPFLDAMTASATRSCFVLLAAIHSDAVLDPLWRHFHGVPRATNPTFLDAVALLTAGGQRATVEVVRGSGGTGYRTVAEAVPDLREQLALPDDPATLRDLRNLLAGWLVRRAGLLRPPGAPLPVAIIRWSPRPR